MSAANARHSTPTPKIGQRSPLAGIDRRKVAEAVERLIAVLDALDGDADLEPSLAAPENHPMGSYLFGPHYGYGVCGSDMRGSQLGWADGAASDHEDDAGDNPEEPGAVMVRGWAEPDVRRVRRARTAV